MALKENSELYGQIKEFLKESSAKYSKDVARAKNDLDFYGGNYWEYTPDQLVRKSRANLSFSELPKYVGAIKSSAQKSPWHNELVDEEDNAENRETIEQLQDAIDKFENSTNYKATLLNSLEMDIITGNGSLNLTTLGKIEDVKIDIENIRDISTIAYDPNCIREDMSDAEQGAIVNYIPKRKAKRLYGDDVVNIGSSEIVFGDQWAVEPNTIPQITYYELVKEGCRVVKMIGKYVIEESVLPISRIPLFKLTGYGVFRNNMFTSVGIVDRIKDLQIGANIGYSSLIERMNRSAKAGFICTAESINGIEKEIPKLSSGDVPLFIYKEGTTEPKPIVEQFQVQDLQAVINSSQELIADTIGIPKSGVQGINNLTSTATEALLRQENSESNVGVFYDALQRVSKSIGECIVELYGFNKDDFAIRTVNGPNTITKNAKRRQDLLQLANLMPENVKPLIAKYFAESLDDEVGVEIADNITANLDPSINLVQESEDPVAMHQLEQAKQMIETQAKTLEEMQAQIVQLTKENETLNLSLIDGREQRALEYTKTLLEQQYNMEIKKAELELKSVEVASKFEAEMDKNQLKAAEIYQKQIASNNDLIVGMTENPNIPAITETMPLYEGI